MPQSIWIVTTNWPKRPAIPFINKEMADEFAKVWKFAEPYEEIVYDALDYVPFPDDYEDKLMADEETPLICAQGCPFPVPWKDGLRTTVCGLPINHTGRHQALDGTSWE